MSNVIKLERNITKQIGELETKRAQVNKTLGQLRNEAWKRQQEILQIDTELTYLRRLLFRVNNPTDFLDI